MCVFFLCIFWAVSLSVSMAMAMLTTIKIAVDYDGCWRGGPCACQEHVVCVSETSFSLSLSLTFCFGGYNFSFEPDYIIAVSGV
ncbi:hypothetical protein F4703DRAFT_1848302 [Phycomyces blakesleeanus]